MSLYIYFEPRRVTVSRPLQPLSRVNRASLLWCALVKQDLFRLGLADVYDAGLSVEGESKRDTFKVWCARVQIAVETRECAETRRQIEARPLLRTYKQLQLQSSPLSLARYLTVPHGGWNDLRLIGRRLLTSLRCGVNQLRLHTGRWEGGGLLPPEERTCLCCYQQSETESHFLLRCALYSDERAALYSTINRLHGEAQQRAAESRARRSKPPRTATVLHIQSESPAIQLKLMLGDGHSSMKNKQLYSSVTSAVMVAVAVWMKKRARYLTVDSTDSDTATDEESSV